MTIKKEFLKFEETLNKRVNRAVRFGLRPTFMQRLSEQAADQVRRRTQLGRGVNPATKKTFRLAPLKDTTVDYRERYASRLSKKTTVGRSNITATGQLLKAITGYFSKNKIVIFFQENRRRTLSGSGPIPKHRDIAIGLSKGNKNTVPRPFFDLSTAERNGLARKIREQVLKGLK